MKDPQNQKNEARSFTPGKNNYVTQNESPRLVPFESQRNTFGIQPKCTPQRGRELDYSTLRSKCREGEMGRKLSADVLVKNLKKRISSVSSLALDGRGSG